MNASEIRILPTFGDIFDSSRGDGVPDDLIGAKIVAIGAPSGMKEQPEGGGLAIKYIPAQSQREKIIILSTLR